MPDRYERLVDPQLVLTALLASASDLLAESLEAEDAIRSLTRLVVPAFADWSVTTIIEDGRYVSRESWHRDPALRETTGRFAAHVYEGRDAAEGSLAAMASGQPFILSENVMEFARQTLRSPVAIAAFEELAPGSIVVIPLLGEAGVLGVMTLVRGQRRPAMGESEISAAVDVARRAATALRNARSFGQQREIAEQLQLSMLTPPVQPDHVEIVVRYKPAVRTAQVGGDWYDAFVQPGGATTVIVGDVVGHDMFATAAMGQLRNMMRGISVTTNSGPATLLADTDLALQTLQLDTTATALVLRLEQEPEEIEQGVTRVRYASAGHLPALLVSDVGHVDLLEAEDLMLGVMPEMERHDHVMPLLRGSTLLLYTDGLIERRHESLTQSLARLERTVAELHSLPTASFVDQLMKRLLEEDHDDDVVLVALRLHDQDGPRPQGAGPQNVPPNVPPTPPAIEARLEGPVTDL